MYACDYSALLSADGDNYPRCAKRDRTCSGHESRHARPQPSQNQKRRSVISLPTLSPATHKTTARSTSPLHKTNHTRGPPRDQSRGRMWNWCSPGEKSTVTAREQSARASPAALDGHAGMPRTKTNQPAILCPPVPPNRRPRIPHRLYPHPPTPPPPPLRVIPITIQHRRRISHTKSDSLAEPLPSAPPPSPDPMPSVRGPSDKCHSQPLRQVNYSTCYTVLTSRSRKCRSTTLKSRVS